MKTRFTVSFLAIALFATAPLFAQTAGSISGLVTDATTGDPLPVANVVIQNTHSGDAADREGRYTIAQLKPGTYTLTATYIGYVDAVAQVVVTSGQTATADFALNSITLDGGAIVITGAREGQSRALSRQKNADTIMNVISAEQVGRFPDQNTADALQRVPAVSIIRDMGEGRYVSLRGMNPDMNAVSVNGGRLPSPDSDQRRIPLDVIPVDVVGSLEINKTLTPDMEADAVGGSIDIITKSPHDFGGRHLSGTVAGGLNLINDKGNAQAGFTYSDLFNKLGFLVSGSYSRTDRATYNNKFSYDEEDVDGTDQFVTTKFTTQDYVTVRTRIGLTATLDYRFDRDNTLYIRGLFNDYDDDETRYGNQYLFNKGDYTGIRSVTEGRVLKHIKPRRETQNIISLETGGNHTLAELFGIQRVKLDYQVAYSYADETEPDRYDSGFLQKDIDMSWAADPDYPKVSLDQAAFRNYTAYEFDELEYYDNKTSDTDISFKTNLELPMKLLDNPFDVKVGAKIRMKSKENDPTYRLYDGWDGDSDFTLDQVLGSYMNDDYMYGKMGYQGKYQDRDSFVDFFNANKSDFELNNAETRIEEDSNTYEATENIYAGYGMATWTSGNLKLLGGLRAEKTDIEYTGYRVELDEEEEYVGTTKITGDADYFDLFPSLTAKYSFNRNTNLRAAITRSISRPNHFVLVPFERIYRADEEIERGNPELNPTRAWGLDLLGEHYFSPMGLVSMGVFYKTLEDNLFESVSEVSGGANDGYKVTQWINGDAASVMGIEMNYGQQFTFLPGYLKGLGVDANMTFVDSEADVTVDGTKRTTSLAGQSDLMGNFSVAYEHRGFTGRFSINHQGELLSEVGEQSRDDYYIGSHTQLDLSLNQKVRQDASLFLEVQNLTDEPLREYQGDSDHPRELEYYGRWVSFGVKFVY